MLLFKFVPPSPFSTVSTILFSMSASPLLPCKQAQQYPSRFHVYVLIHDTCFSLSDLTSLCIIGSRFIYLIRTDSDALLFIAEWYSIVYMYHNFFIHSSVNGLLGCFRVLSVVNSTAMNIGVHVYFWSMVFSRYMFRINVTEEHRHKNSQQNTHKTNPTIH